MLMTDVDVDLSLEVGDAITCMICDGEAVMTGVTTVPCGHPQHLCLPHYENELPKWQPGDQIWCYPCVSTTDNPGVFLRWEKVGR